MVLQLGQFGCVAGLHAVCLPTSARDQRTYAQSHSEPDGDATANSDTNSCSESHAAAVANTNAERDCHAETEAYAQAASLLRVSIGNAFSPLLQDRAIPVGSGVTVVDCRFRGFDVSVDQRAEFVGVPVFSCSPPGLESWIRHGVGDCPLISSP